MAAWTACSSSGEVQDHFAVHPETPIDPEADRRHACQHPRGRHRLGLDNRYGVLERDDRRRIYWIEPALLESLKCAFDRPEARPDLLRQEPTGP
ncbi:hypothetical protein [Streptomyces sp. NPDC102476]|uniref:hypothetical protein n=1 Tax=Streptomyces sp. NPDC102476 TaxID=3366181 RepID=UPI003827D533